MAAANETPRESGVREAWNLWTAATREQRGTYAGDFASFHADRTAEPCEGECWCDRCLRLLDGPAVDRVGADGDGDARGELALCGRLLIGQGDDTYDPLCGLPEGHEGKCYPKALDDARRYLNAALDGHGLGPQTFSRGEMADLEAAQEALNRHA